MIKLSLESLKNTAKSRPDGYLEDVLSRAEIDGDNVTLTSEAYRALLSKYRPPQRPPAPAKSPRAARENTNEPRLPAPPPSGPGTELKKLLATIGIHATPTCKCNKMAKQMDAWGWEESLKHIDEIVTVMEETAKKRKLPFVRTAGKTLVRIACWKAKRAGNSK
jgi:hypothetical protein